MGILENKRDEHAKALRELVTESEGFMSKENFDPKDSEYVALREKREKMEDNLSDVIATIAARRLALPPSKSDPNSGGRQESACMKVLREYDGRGNSEMWDFEYVLRAYAVLKTSEPLFDQNPTRIDPGTPDLWTPSLDSVSRIPSSNKFDFTVPPLPKPAGSVAELEAKPAALFSSRRVQGELGTDAHILDVSRQTLEDDSTAEQMLRVWLTQGVTLRQDAKVASAIAGAVGTLTADGIGVAAAIRNGQAVLSSEGIRATHVHMNPLDASALDQAAAMQMHTGPLLITSPWSLARIENPAIPIGQPIVGSMQMAVYLLYRSAISTYLTDAGLTVEDTPRDRFRHNIFGVLGEGRSHVEVVRPELLVRCTVLPDPEPAREETIKRPAN
jgi:hypothetical protein